MKIIKLKLKENFKYKRKVIIKKFNFKYIYWNS